MAFFETNFTLALERLPTRLALGQVERRILRRKLGVGGLEPGVELGPEGLGFTGLAPGQIMFLRRILGQVVQFVTTVLVVIDELPVGLCDGSANTAADRLLPRP